MRTERNIRAKIRGLSLEEYIRAGFEVSADRAILIPPAC